MVIFHYLQDIIGLLYKINVGAKELKCTSIRLQTVANYGKGNYLCEQR